MLFTLNCQCTHSKYYLVFTKSTVTKFQDPNLIGINLRSEFSCSKNFLNPEFLPTIKWNRKVHKSYSV